ncbi:MAG: hypothetical protein V5A68_08225, partial [Candidatus Thermoplasmatota archaeon]
ACEMEHILHPQTMNVIIKFVELLNSCNFSPIWLDRLKRYVETDELPNCPEELSKICEKYTKRKK